MQSDNREARMGLLSAVIALVLWGVFPLFWMQFGALDALQVVAHRVVWAFAILAVLLPLLIVSLEPATRSKVRQALCSPKVWIVYLCAAGLIAFNWLVFIWAVNHGRVLDASLGYYINPLCMILLGVLVLGERLSMTQWVAVSSAATGVGIMTLGGVGSPWVSLLLAGTFAIYALVKKLAPLPALIGLLLETGALSVPAIGLIVYLESSTPDAVIASGQWGLLALLILGGAVTIAPLALFGYAAPRAPLSVLGVLQYIAPTMQFLLGVLLLGEPLDGRRLLGFAFVWIGLSIFTWAGMPKSFRPAIPWRARLMQNAIRDEEPVR